MRQILFALLASCSGFPSFATAPTAPRVPSVVTINADRNPTDHESLSRHGVKAFVMPDSGHFLMVEGPPRFNRSLDSVVKGFAK